MMKSGMKTNTLLVPMLIALLVSTAGPGIAQTAVGPGPGPGMGGGMGGVGGPACAMRGGMPGQGRHRAGMEGGRHGKHGKHQCNHGQARRGQHLFGGNWKQSLSAEQKVQLDRLHVNQARIKAPLKARIKALKVDLTVLATAPEPDKIVIDAKIEDMLKLKGQLLGAEYGYIAAQRRVLTPVQQVSFDMEKIHGAMHGKKGKGGKGMKR